MTTKKRRPQVLEMQPQGGNGNQGKVEMRLLFDPQAGSVQVFGFPANMELALTILHLATKAVATFFVRGAAEGKVTVSQGEEPGRIIRPAFVPPRDVLKGKADH